MIKQKHLFIGFAFLLLAVMACNAILPQAEPDSPAPTQAPIFTLAPSSTDDDLPQTEADVPRVSVEEAKAALAGGEAVIVDVRSAQAYAEVHIAGAISIPLDQFENNIANVSLEKDQWIITYCT